MKKKTSKRQNSIRIEFINMHHRISLSVSDILLYISPKVRQKKIFFFRLNLGKKNSSGGTEKEKEKEKFYSEFSNAPVVHKNIFTVMYICICSIYHN